MSTMTATTKTTYRKTKKGEWVVCGPTSSVRPGSAITVTKKSGETKTEQVERVGRPFRSGGVELVYGYLAARRPARSTRRDYEWWDAGCGCPGANGIDMCLTCGDSPF